MPVSGALLAASQSEVTLEIHDFETLRAGNNFLRLSVRLVVKLTLDLPQTASMEANPRPRLLPNG